MLDNLLPNLDSFSGVSKRGPPGSLLGPSRPGRSRQYIFSGWLPASFLSTDGGSLCDILFLVFCFSSMQKGARVTQWMPDLSPLKPWVDGFYSALDVLWFLSWGLA